MCVSDILSKSDQKVKTTAACEVMSLTINHSKTEDKQHVISHEQITESNQHRTGNLRLFKLKLYTSYKPEKCCYQSSTKRFTTNQQQANDKMHVTSHDQ
jgi:hypothetical protein